jgi:hypothetical protein
VTAIFVSTCKLPDIPAEMSLRVEPGTDAADLFIEGRAEAGDLVVTRDIPFAERMALKGIAAINDRGELFTAENAGERRSLRDAAAELRFLGFAPPSPRASRRTAKDTKHFADALDRILTALRDR